MSDIRSNFSINKIKQAGLKDQLKGYMFRVKFFNFNDNNPLNSLNTIGSGEQGQDIILYTKKVEGLPAIEIEKVADNFYGLDGQIPTKPKFSSNEITIDFRISEKMNPIKPFLDRLLLLTQTQLDFESGEVVTMNNDKDIDITYNLSAYDRLFTDDGNLISSISDNFFFNTTVSLMEYNTRKPILTYILRNSWISKLQIATGVGEGVDVINGQMTITFDYPEIYKVSGSGAE